jgi:hypothetical protein
MFLVCTELLLERDTFSTSMPIHHDWKSFRIRTTRKNEILSLKDRFTIFFQCGIAERDSILIRLCSTKRSSVHFFKHSLIFSFIYYNWLKQTNLHRKYCFIFIFYDDQKNSIRDIPAISEYDLMFHQDIHQEDNGDVEERYCSSIYRGQENLYWTSNYSIFTTISRALLFCHPHLLTYRRVSVMLLQIFCLSLK